MNRIVTIIAAALTCIVARASDEPIPPHLQAAIQIAHQIDQSHNEYAHKGCFIKWKGEDGAAFYENRSDCSDFLDLLLEHVYHFTSAQMKGWTGHERPFAISWYETISAGKGFTIVPNVQSIKPGDVIAIKYPAGSADTGHIMIAAATPEPHRDTAPLQPGMKQWELLVVDSSKSGHGKDDTRRLADGTYARGVGEGTVRLYSSSDGMIVGYAWSVASVSAFQAATEHKIVVGRLQPRN